MTIEIRAQIVNYFLTEVDSGVAVENSKTCRKKIDQHYSGTGIQKQNLGRLTRYKASSQWLAAEDVVDDDFKRPRFK